MSGGNGDYQFVSYLNEADDAPVTIKNWQPGEDVGLIWDGDTLGPAEQGDVTMAQDPETGTVQLFVRGHCVAIVENAVDFTLDQVGLVVDYSEAA